MIDDLISLADELVTTLRTYLTAVEKGAHEWQVKELRKELSQLVAECRLHGLGQ